MALTDKSAFILCKANAAMFLEETQHPDTFCYKTCRETLTYYGQCVRQVTERLSNAQERISEGIITCILGLICHDVCFSHFSSPLSLTVYSSYTLVPWIVGYTTSRDWLGLLKFDEGFMISTKESSFSLLGLMSWDQ